MWVKPVLWALVAALCVFVLAVLLKSPRHDRVWADDVSRLPELRTEVSGTVISNYRTWRYDHTGPIEKQWVKTAPFAVEDIRQTWFAVEPHPGVPGMAHTMVVFELKDGRLLGVSVEARKERGEPYGLARGTFNGFELIYVWASPQDMFTRRVRVQNHEIYMYRLNLTADEARAYHLALIDKTRAIEASPRFYNTFGSNCTNELAKTAGLKWHPAFIFTGNAPAALFKMDRLKGEGGFVAQKQAANVTDVVRQHADAPESFFNQALLHALSAQQDAPT